MLIVEQDVIGANVGANGYTTISQVNDLARRLALKPTMALLDIGSGRGWPALYLAENLGCRTTLLDVPETALRTAMRGADRQQLTNVSVVRGTADLLPFPSDGFDAITHTDTL